MSGHSVRIREKRWKEIEKKAWDLSSKAKKIIKPTDVVDTAIALNIKELEIEDVNEAMKNR